VVEPAKATELQELITRVAGPTADVASTDPEAVEFLTELDVEQSADRDKLVRRLDDLFELGSAG
jgi:hypothetical protein